MNASKIPCTLFWVALAAACGDEDTLSLSPRTIPAAEVGVTYSATISVSGLPDPSWFIFGDVPGGLTLRDLDGNANAPTGTRIFLTGTPVTVGTFSFRIRAQGPSQGIQAPYVLQVSGQTNPLRITTANLPPAEVGVQYDALILATGGTGQSYTWSASGLPSGLQLESSGTPGSRIVGQPETAGPFDVSVQVEDSQGNRTRRDLRIVVEDPASRLRITTASLPAGRLGRQYQAELVAVGGGTGDTNWFATGLPEGIRLEPGTPTALLTGTPNQTGTFPVGITVVRGGQSADAFFTLTVEAPPSLTVLTRSIPAGAVGVPYEAELDGFGGVPPYEWTFDPALPQGLEITQGTPTATISGTPEAGGDFTIDVILSDGLGTEVRRPTQLAIQGGAPVIQPTNLPAGTAAMAYTASVQAVGGEGTLSWSLVDDGLPDGLSLEDARANPVTLTGVLREFGSFAFTLRVEDELGQSDEALLNLEVSAPPVALSILTTSLPVGVEQEAYVAQLQSQGGTGIDVSWSVLDPLPPGLSNTPIDGRDLLIFGTPTSTGTFPVRFEVEDSSGATDAASLSLTITSSTGI